MGIYDFETYSKWIEILKQQAESRGLDFQAKRVNPNLQSGPYKFKISSNTAAVKGKTHHSNRFGNRSGDHIETVYESEKELISSKTEQGSNEDQYDEIEIFAIIINHECKGEYNPEKDDFLVFNEQILEDEIPSSNQKKFRDDSVGYPPPFGNHVNDWERIFELFENC